MIFTLLALPLLWLGSAWLLSWWRGRPVGKDSRRSVSTRICAVGDRVSVTLSLAPPPGRDPVPDHDVVLLLDRSGSMGAAPGSPFQEMLRAAILFVGQLPENVRIGVIAFDHGSEERARLQQDRDRLVPAIQGIAPGGGTSISGGLDAVNRMLTRERRPGVPATVILCTDGGDDREATVTAAARLSEAHPDITVLAAGFGTGVDHGLLNQVATRRDLSVVVRDPQDLPELFGRMAEIVAGGGAVAGLVEERVNGRGPWILLGHSPLQPIVQSHADEGIRTVWSFPASSLAEVQITYELEARCPGWHAPVLTPASVVWKRLSGAQDPDTVPVGPYVLVLPALLRWMGLFFHPLLFRTLLRDMACPPVAHVVPHMAALPDRPQSLPPPPPATRSPPLVPGPARALVIAIGDAGAGMLRHLRTPDDKDGFSAIHVGVGGALAPVLPDGVQAVTLTADVARAMDGGKDWAWLPMGRWEADTRPLTTAGGHHDDRVLARVSLLLNPASIRTAIDRILERLPDDAPVLICGDAACADYSGLALEIAHMVASRKRSSFMLLAAPAPLVGRPQEIAAFAAEINRFVILNGEPVTSLRGGVPVIAQRLLEQVLVLEGDLTPGSTERRLAALAWQLVHRPALRSRVQRVSGGKVVATAIHDRRIDVTALWTAARDAALFQTLVLGWMGGTTDHRPDPVDGAALAERFWNAGPLQHGPTPITGKMHEVLDGANVLALVNAVDPVGRAPYHDQVAYSRADQRAFILAVEQWAFDALAPQEDGHVWRLPELIAAMDILERSFQRVEGIAAAAINDPIYAAFMGFVVGQIKEYTRIFRAFREECEDWHRALIGEPQIGGPLEGLALVLKEKAAQSRLMLALPGSRAPALLDARMDEWCHGLLGLLPRRWRLQPKMKPGDNAIGLVMATPQGPCRDPSGFAQALPALIEDQRAIVLSWPDADWFDPVRDGPRQGDILGAGAHVGMVFGGTDFTADEWDGFDATILGMIPATPAEALHCTGQRPDAGYFSWPEEAAAARIAHRVFLRTGQHSAAFTPFMISCLGNPHRLHDWLWAIARGVVAEGAGGLTLTMPGEGRLIDLVEVEPGARLEALLRRVLISGAVEPPVTGASGLADELVASMARVGWLGEVRNRADWPAWCDLLRGVVYFIEDNGQ